MEFIYYPKGVCSKKITIRVEDGVVEDVAFEGGCNGNLQGIGRLVKGFSPDEVVERLEGLQCRMGTSCPDQLAKAMREMTGSAAE